MENTPKKKIDAYRKTDVLTASKESILLMLYAGAIRFLKQAIEAGEHGENMERARLLSRTQEIVTELRSSLNFEAGADIAKYLDSLYGFVSHRLIQGNLENGLKGLQEALEVLETLNTAWEGAVASVRRK